MNRDSSMNLGAEKLAPIFGALSDATRLKILRLLLERRRVCVCELVERFRLGQSTISHHMAILKQAGLVKGARRGQWTDYYLVPRRAVEQAIAFLQVVSASKEQPAQEVSSDRCPPLPRGARSAAPGRAG